jgi:hypothetical protein
VAAGVVVARRVGVVVAVALSVGVALAVGVAFALDVALAVDLSVGLAVAELWPELPDEGDGVRDAPPEAVLVVACGVGVKMDGTVEDGDPPPVQAATATARMAAPAAARPARTKAPRLTAGLDRAGRVRSDRVCAGRIGAGQLATGTVRRTFMKPPRITGGQWRRSTHLSMCHPIRQ